MPLPVTPNTTCDVYRNSHSPPTAPDVNGVTIQLTADFGNPHQSATVASQTSARWTHIAKMPLGTDVRDGYGIGANAGVESATTGFDSIYVPDKNGTRFCVIFVERIGYGTAADYLLVYLQRGPAPWPTQNL